MNPVVALLGKRDQPTDALEEYCHYLGEALVPHQIELSVQRVAWDKLGWSQALGELERCAADWEGQWVVLQYTALAWSSRGFPQKVLGVLKLLKSLEMRSGVVFHDVEPFHGSRLIDRLRRNAQISTMRRAADLADLAIFPVDPSRLSWLKTPPKNALFIPVGPNLPISTQAALATCPHDLPTVGVFSITGGDNGARETREILATIRSASGRVGKLRLMVFGRHAEMREAALRDGLRGLPVELSVEGVASPPAVIEKFRQCDVVLFVRGVISSRRSSAIAAISCGLPVIAYSGAETAPPVTDAGVVLIPEGRADELAPALVHVLTDEGLRSSLSSRSQAAYERSFSWNQIAAAYAKHLSY
jgi:hypothetical protein